MSNCMMLEIANDGRVYELCGGDRKLSVFKAADVRKALSGSTGGSISVQKAACSCSVEKVAAPKSTEQSVPQYGQVSPERQALADAEKNFDTHANVSVDSGTSGSQRRR